MEKQKFYIIFLLILLFIGFKACLLLDFKIVPQYDISVGDDFFAEGKMFNGESKSSNKSNNNAKNKRKPVEYYNITYARDVKFINVNPPTPLSGKTKSEIYDLRKNYVMSSVFASKNYKPSEAVFGGIVSGKPWISANVCINPNTGKLGITGPSEESRFINNPTMLVAIEYPYPVRYTDSDTCSSYKSELIPKEISYSKSKNEVTVTYNYLPFTTYNNSSFYMFNGVNARDLGYPYAYVDNSKSTYKVDFVNSDNISTGIKEFQNFIHLGGSCGYEGGCNNGSPRQSFLEFKSNDTSYNYKYREIYIKLWKKKPKNTSDKPDVVERIILEWS